MKSLRFSFTVHNNFIYLSVQKDHKARPQYKKSAQNVNMTIFDEKSYFYYKKILLSINSGQSEMAYY